MISCKYILMPYAIAHFSIGVKKFFHKFREISFGTSYISIARVCMMKIKILIRFLLCGCVMGGCLSLFVFSTSKKEK